MAPLTPLEQQQLDVAPASTFWHRVRFGLIVDHLRTRPTTAVLDVGAGSGLLGEHLRPTGVRYRFSESSPSLREALVSRYGAGNLDDGGTITSDSVVTLLDVIEHVEDDTGLLTELAWRMRPGAGLVVTVPAMSWLFSSWDTDLGHFRRYGKRQLRALVSSCGFEVEEAAYLFPELIPPALLRKLRRSTGEAADFPDLPGFVDRTAGFVSGASARLRRWWPAGTSVLVVAHRTTDPVAPS